MDRQAKQVDPGDTLQVYLDTLQEEFRRVLMASLKRSGLPERIQQEQEISQGAAFKFVVDGSRQCSPSGPL